MTFRSRKGRSKLKSHHREFLTSKETLAAWLPYSLRRRVKLFHRHFTELTISISSLLNIYRSAGIKYKKLHYKTYFTPLKLEQIKQSLRECLPQVLSAITQHRTVLFIDEVTFSSKTRKEHTWFLAGAEAVVYKRQLHFPVVACVGAIDQHGSLVQLSTFEKSVNKDKFIQFLEELSQKVDLQEALMFLDNLSVHHSLVVKDWAAAHGLELLFNAPYSSEFNPIELLWAFSKRSFYDDEAVVQASWRYQQVRQQVVQHVEAVPKEHVAKAVAHILKKMRAYLESQQVQDFQSQELTCLQQEVR